MHKLFLFLIIIILLAPINLSEDLNQEKKIQTSTIARVYVNPPNFTVIGESSHEIFTVIKDAPLPNTYDGTLIQLESDDVTYLKKAINNLNTKKVILFKEDAKLANQLEDLKIEII